MSNPFEERILRGWMPLGLFRTAQVFADYGLKWKLDCEGVAFRSQLRPWPALVFEDGALRDVLSQGETDQELGRMRSRIARLYGQEDFSLFGQGLVHRLPERRVRFEFAKPLQTPQKITHRPIRWILDCEDRRKAVLATDRWT